MSEFGVIEKIVIRLLVADFDDMFAGVAVPDWVRHPAAHYVRFPRRGQQATLVEIHTSTGLTGIGEAYGLPSAAVTHAAIEHVLAPMLLGRDAADHNGIRSDCSGVLRSHGHAHGPYLEALAGLDIALWDLAGKARQESLVHMLGGSEQAQLSCYAGSVPFRATPQESADHARTFLDAGFDGIKVKVGRSPEREKEHLRAIREAVGPHVRLMLDANGIYSVNDAVRLAHLVEPENITWFEEPVAVGDFRALAQVRDKIGQQVASGECEFTAAGVAEMLRARSIDVLIPNVAKLGGVSELRRAVHLCELDGIAVSPHGVGSAISLAAAVHVSASTNAFDTFEVNQLANPLRDDLAVVNPVRLSGSRLQPLPGHGLGVDVRPEVINRYEAQPATVLTI